MSSTAADKGGSRRPSLGASRPGSARPGSARSFIASKLMPGAEPLREAKVVAGKVAYPSCQL
eukprot:19455-Prymnesium_polylepis.1